LIELIKKYAKKTRGFSGADLKNLVNESAILACRYKDDAVGEKHLEEAYDKIMFGIVSDTKKSDKSLKVTAYHEAGHTVVARLLDFPVEKASILSRDKFLGVTVSEDKLEEGEQYNRTELIRICMIALGGYVAEEEIFGDVTPGAIDDLNKLGRLLYSMVNDFGMIKPLEGVSRSGVSSDGARQKFDEVTLKLNKIILKKTRTLIKNNKDLVEKIAKKLLEQETLEKEEIDEIIGDRVGLELESSEYKIVFDELPDAVSFAA
jgi:ATP-dependent Zn protease